LWLMQKVIKCKMHVQTVKWHGVCEHTAGGGS
jgi:hypothetical protein